MNKKLLLLMLGFLLSIIGLQAQLAQTVTVSPGDLSSQLGTNKTKVTDLTLKGSMGAQDFQTLREMTALKSLDMVNVSLPDNTLPNQAFKKVTWNNLLLPSTLKQINDRAFDGATISNSIVLPNGFTTIGANAFLGTKLTIDFSKCTSSLASIGSYAFMNSNVNGGVLDLGNHLNLKTINSHAFGTMGIAGKITIPRNMETLTGGFFRNYKGEVVLSPVLKQIDDRAFENAEISNTVVLPNGFTTVGANAFLGVKNLAADFSKCTSSLTSIGGYAFSGSGVNNGVLDFGNHSNLKTIAYNAFGSIDGGHVTLPKNMEVVTMGVFRNYNGSVILPPALKQINDRAFENAEISNTVVLPNGFTTISPNAFFGVKILTVDFSKCTSSLASIGGYAFSGTGVNKGVLDFGNHLNLKTIAYNAFGSMDGGHVTVPKNMEVLTIGAFRNYNGSVVLPQVLEKIEPYVFDNAKIKELVLHKDVSFIDSRAFYNAQINELISENPVPPALGKSVFEGMNVPTCRLSVPAGSVNLYGTTDQWKEFITGVIDEGSIKINVTDSKTGGLANGGKYKITKDGVLVGLFDGNNIASGLFFGTYQVVEESAPLGYYSSADGVQSVVINNSTKDVAVAFKNEKSPSGNGVISIRTRDFKNRHALVHSRYEIYNNRNELVANGEVSKELFYDAEAGVYIPAIEGKPIYGDSIIVIPIEVELPYGEYLIKEIKAPSLNYKISSSQSVKLTADSVSVLFLSELKDNGTLTVTIEDEDSKSAISTGEYIIVDWENNIVKQGSPINGKIEVSNLPYGWYVIRETKAPVGYIPNVYHNLRAAIYAGGENGRITMSNKKGELKATSYPGSVDLVFTVNGVDEPYKGVKIGEYLWLNQNLKESALSRYGAITAANIDQNHKAMAMFNYHRPPREASLNMLMEPSYWAYGITPKDVNDSYGATITMNFFQRMSTENGLNSIIGDENYRNDNGTQGKYITLGMKENSVVNNSWKVPSPKDILQLVGMCGEGIERDVRQYLSWGHDDPNAPIVAKATNSVFNPETANNKEPNGAIYNGYDYFYWFDNTMKDPNTNKFGFNWVPAITRLHNGSTTIPTEHYGYRFYYTVNQGDIYTWNQAGRIRSNHAMYLENGDGAFMNYFWDYADYTMRLCRPMTDQELGYKLWINQDMSETEFWGVPIIGEEHLLKKIDDGLVNRADVKIVKTSITSSAPAGYVEMPKGYTRGLYVQFILDNPQPEKSVSDILQMAAGRKFWYQWTPKPVPVPTPETRQALISDDQLIENEQISIHPNPVIDVLNIEGYSSVTSLSLYSGAGSLVLKQSHVGPTLDMSGLPTGMYILKLQTENGTSTHKVMKR